MYVFDIDGTIADCRHRIHHIKGIPNPDWEAFDRDGHKDAPIWSIIAILGSLYRCGHRIVLATGRGERGREYTERWLDDYGIQYHHMIMRPDGDHRPDTIVKKEEFDKFLVSEGLKPSDVIAIFEDRQRVVDMWRTAGYKVLQVDPGNY